MRCCRRKAEITSARAPELIAFVKAAGAKFNVALDGPGTPNHLGLAQFDTMLGVDVRGIQ